MRARSGLVPPLESSPTAHALDDEVAATPRRRSLLSEPPGSLLFCTFHAAPFQRSTRVWKPVLFDRQPTAQALLEEVAATRTRAISGPARRNPPFTGLEPAPAGLVWRVHFLPFQCSTRV